jgi:hypothetical protein
LVALPTKVRPVGLAERRPGSLLAADRPSFLLHLRTRGPGGKRAEGERCPTPVERVHGVTIAVVVARLIAGALIDDQP